ncbi:MAG: T9SS C-terminal target domain-containing protein [Haliscomenobacteraceae bacterium CHB4]|nr:hypothetical protein [Saprospiraceae bacterium]MCE7922115.1 T9SS C-terminal target domain-containing protein [Haliscomenobacteraceae bacterium CHB4]
MKYFYFPHAVLTASVLFALNSPYSQAQSLPDAMYFSDEDHILYTNGRESGGLYDESQIRTFHLWFSQPDYWQQLKNNYQTKTDLPALLVVDGDTFPDVGVRFKGQTSYMMTQTSDKKSFNISLDYSDPNQDLEGYQTLNLNNAFEDASFMREVSYLHQIRRHIPAAKSAYVRLFINGQSWGIYPNVQQLNGDYIEEWFFSNDGTRWRADRPDGAFGGGPGGPGGGWGDGTAALNYLGPDTTEYQEYYTLKSANKPNPWDDLVRVCDVLNNTPLDSLEAAIRSVLDLDRTLWFLASEIAFSDDDSYVFKGKMDYYLYWDPETGRITPLEFDGNSVMKNNAVNWGPFYNANKVNYPLLNRLLAVPSIRQRYLAHFRTLISEEMNTADFNALIDQYDALINAEVQADPKKLYSYNQYNTEKQALKNFVQNHRNTLLNNPEMNATGPVIANATLQSNGGAWVNPLAGESVTVTATATSADGIAAVSLYYSPALYGNFSKTEMFDDGQHSDGASGDGIFGASIPGFDAATYVRFYVEAIANNTPGTRSYLPAGAEHDVFMYQVEAGWANNVPVVINEILASNQNAETDEEGEHEDWIELYNTSNLSFDLSGFYITDNPSNLDKWDFPAGTVIPPYGYLILWADEDSSQGPLHCNFKLSAAGEFLALLDPTLNFVDTVNFQQQITDMGYARVPNGTGPFVIQNRTFAASNSVTPTSEPGNAFQVWVYPTIARDWLSIKLPETNAGLLTVFDVLGNPVLEMPLSASNRLSVSGLPSGIYLASIRSGGRTVTKKFIIR